MGLRLCVICKFFHGYFLFISTVFHDKPDWTLVEIFQLVLNLCTFWFICILYHPSLSGCQGWNTEYTLVLSLDSLSIFPLFHLRWTTFLFVCTDLPPIYLHIFNVGTTVALLQSFGISHHLLLMLLMPKIYQEVTVARGTPQSAFSLFLGANNAGWLM